MSEADVPGQDGFEELLQHLQQSRGFDFSAYKRASLDRRIRKRMQDAGIDSYSAFLEADRTTPTGLAGYLRERNLDKLYVCGLATDFCVAWTALDARAAGFDTTVIEEACRAIDLDGSLARAWADLTAAGVKRD